MYSQNHNSLSEAFSPLFYLKVEHFDKQRDYQKYKEQLAKGYDPVEKAKQPV